MDKTHDEDLAVMAGPRRAPGDVPAVARRGFLECYYGAPWSDRDRRTMLAEAAHWGMNAYCYGPSGDPHTGTAWRQPYSAAELDTFAGLADFAAQHGIEFCWRVSPSAPLAPANGIALHDPAERDLLLARLDDIVAAGAHTILLTFDDVEHGLFHAGDRQAFGADPHPTAAAHAQLVRAVAAHLAQRDVRLVACPTRYWGTGDDAYTQRLFELIDVPVEVCWTGPRVTSTRIDGTEAAQARQRRGGHPLFLWDNYPVNDWDGFDPTTGVPAQRRLFLGPLVGREAAVAEPLGSYMVNCGAQPLAGLPALATAAQWASDPAAYDPASAWDAVLDRYDDTYGSLAFLASLSSTSPIALTRAHPLATATYRYLLAESGDDASAALRTELAGARERLERVPTAGDGVLGSLRDWVEDLTLRVHAADAAVRAIDGFSREDSAVLAEAAQWLADRRQQLDAPFPAAMLDGALTSLIERGRGLAGAPVPPHDV